MGFMRLVVVGMLLILTSARPCLAAITWDQTRLEATAPVEQEKLQTTFSFKNTGDRAVTIVSVNTSCGCTTVTLQKQTYEPGEAGEIQTIFAFESRTGKQEKTIQVVTNDGRPPTTLVLQVTIVEAFTIKPRILLWKKDGTEKLATKTAVLSASRNLPINPAEVRCENPLFDVKLVPVAPGQRYELQVTPKSIASPANATIRIEIESSPGKRTTTVVYAVVQ